MIYGVQAALWLAGYAGLGLGARYLINKREHR